MLKTETEVTIQAEDREPVTMTTEFRGAVAKMLDRALPGITAFPEWDFKNLFRQWRTLRENRTGMGKTLTGFEKEMIARLENEPDREVIVDGYRVSLQEQKETELDVPVVVAALLSEQTSTLLPAIVAEMTAVQANNLADGFPASADAIQKAQHRVGTGAVRIRGQEREEGAMMPRYDVILSDPPWWYSSRRMNRKTRFGGGARSHYPVMKDSELLGMADQVKAWSADNCALLLWATCPRLDFAIELIRAWGFRYATAAFVWIKLATDRQPWRGCGNYTAANAELVLLGVKGSMPPIQKLVPSVILSNRMEHSRKPAAVIERIELIYPTARKLEMFCRYPQPGWSAWGLEAESGPTPLFAAAMQRELYT